jgi:hypothetical protein
VKLDISQDHRLCSSTERIQLIQPLDVPPRRFVGWVDAYRQTVKPSCRFPSLVKFIDDTQQIESARIAHGRDMKMAQKCRSLLRSSDANGRCGVEENRIAVGIATNGPRPRERPPECRGCDIPKGRRLDGGERELHVPFAGEVAGWNLNFLQNSLRHTHDNPPQAGFDSIQRLAG